MIAIMAIAPNGVKNGRIRPKRRSDATNRVAVGAFDPSQAWEM